MILNSKNSDFSLYLPKNFLYEDIRKRYDKFLSRMPRTYETVIDYLNQSIQSINLDGVNAETVEQNFKYERQQWKSGHDFDRQFTREFTLNFKGNEGYINYWIMFEQFREYLKYKQENEFLPDIYLSYLDRNGYELMTIEFLQITMTNISALDLDFSSVTPEFNTFNCDFTFNYFNIKHRID